MAILFYLSISIFSLVMIIAWNRRPSKKYLANENEENKVNLNERSVQKQVRVKKKLRERSIKKSSLELENIEKKIKGREYREKANNPNAKANFLDEQVISKGWIVLDLGLKPERKPDDQWVAPEKWDVKVFGTYLNSGIGSESNSHSYKKEGGMTLTMEHLKHLGLEKFEAHFHCVTGWSTLNLQFIGVKLKKIISFVKPMKGWECLYQVSEDGYTTNIFRDDLESEDCFLAVQMGDGNPISYEHGGIRIIAPNLFGWKSAKYLKELHFLPKQKNGFWENLGCHIRGRVEFNERWNIKAAGVWDFLTGLSGLFEKILPQTWWVWIMQKGGWALGKVTLNLKKK